MICLKDHIKLIDTHCHLDLPVFDPDRQTVLTNALASGIRSIVVPGIEQATWQRLETLCSQHESLYPALGLHPIVVDLHQQEHLRDLEHRIEITRPVAIGEIGLDFYIADANREKQLAFLDAQPRGAGRGVYDRVLPASRPARPAQHV